MVCGADQMVDLAESEIVPGLVLHLDPISLELEGGRPYSSDNLRVRGDHYFLCVHVVDDSSYWVPLSSKPGETRVKVDRSHKRGNHLWTLEDSYAVASQFWCLSAQTVIAAARAARDHSHRGARHIVTPAGLVAVEEALRQYL